MQRFWFGVGAVVVLSIVSLWYGLNKYARFDISSAGEYDVAERYRLVCGAYPDLQLDASRIPRELHSLIPIAARYGHGNRVLLEDCVSKLSPQDSAEIARKIEEKRPDIERRIVRYPLSFPAQEVNSFRHLLEMYLMMRPINIESGKPVG